MGEKDMAIVSRYVRVWRSLLLGVAVLSLFGPWAFDVINVPAQFACSPPFVRLDGDFCGQPAAGIRLVFWLAGGIVSIGGRLLAGEAAGTELLFAAAFLLPFVPVVLALTAILRRSERASWRLLVAWLLGATAALLLLARSGGLRVPHAWGLWLYVIVALVTAMAEAVALIGDRNPTASTDPLAH